MQRTVWFASGVFVPAYRACLVAHWGPTAVVVVVPFKLQTPNAKKIQISARVIIVIISYCTALRCKIQGL
jgi:hypothetical protein